MERQRVVSSRILTFVAALGIAAQSAYGAATLTADFAKAQTFFGGSATNPVKAVAVFSNGTAQNYVDFSVSPLAIKKISSDGATDYRSINVSPDGKFVAYSVAKKVIVRPVEENTTKKLDVGAGQFPTWWNHPTTGKLYLIYQAAANADVYILEMDMTTLKAVGTAKMLVAGFVWGTEAAPANSGRSADGKYLAGDDGLHGMIELESPLAMENAKVKAGVYFTSPLGWQSDYSHITKGQQYAGWCNGSIAPAKSGSKFYACAQHIGSDHTDLYIRQFPKDLQNPGTLDPKNDCAAKGFHKPPTTVCAPGGVLLNVNPKDGNSHFHGSFWSTHDNYIVTKVGKSKADATWYGYIWDVSALTDTKYLQFLSKGLNKSNDFVHLWVQSGSTKTSHRPVGNANVFSAAIRNRNELQLRYNGDGNYSASILDIHGRIVYATEGRTGSSSISLARLPQGTYMVKIAAPGMSVSTTRFTLAQ